MELTPDRKRYRYGLVYANDVRDVASYLSVVEILGGGFTLVDDAPDDNKHLGDPGEQELYCHKYYNFPAGVYKVIFEIVETFIDQEDRLVTSVPHNFFVNPAGPGEGEG